MKDISFNAYLPLCEQYNNVAQSFYQQHLDAKQQLTQFEESVDLLDNFNRAIAKAELEMGVLQTAICAVVFEAFAIEAYVNFFGAYTLGDSTYYSIYESGEQGKRYSTIEKIKSLCKEQFTSPYPTDGEHFRRLKGLFEKRGRLAHNKPKRHEISTKNGENFGDYYDAMNEISFVYDNLEKEMDLYNEVRMNLTAASKQPEPIDAYIESAATVTAKSFIQMITRDKPPEE